MWLLTMPLQTEGYQIHSDTFKDDTVVFIRDTLHQDVVVKSTHGEVTRAIEIMQRQFRNDGKTSLLRTFRNIAANIRKVDVDSVYKRTKRGVASAEKIWRAMCRDVVLYAACRFVIWKKQIPMQLDVSPDQEIV